MKSLILSTLFILVPQTHASLIAVVDSGTDIKHVDLVSQIWTNPIEIAANKRDEDGNGFQDDIYGWNFAEDNNLVIDYSYLGTLDSNIRKFFTIQADQMYGRATVADKDWVKVMRLDQEFIKKISIYGNFMHGTHVAGITAKGNLNAEIIAVKIMPTEVKLPGAKSLKRKNKGFFDMMLKQMLNTLAKEQMKMMEKVSLYVDFHKVDVVNGSFGTGWPQVNMIVKTVYKTIFRKEPTDIVRDDLARSFLGTLLSEGKRMMAAAPNTLFVFAAGNDGLSNDLYPSSPSNVVADNIISVGATLERSKIATFSNYGINTVDVAAPGVGILSAAPGDEKIRVSGTSQAAPYVANAAAQIVDANGKLTPIQIKQILMGTVDKKAFLTAIIRSGGIVNANRAVYAAKLAHRLSIAEAVLEARLMVKDLAINKSNRKIKSEGYVIPLTRMFR